MPESGEKAKSGTRVRVGYPHSAFENHGVSGVPDPLTDQWTEDPVADAKLKELRKQAKAYDVPLEETTAEEPSR
jgi:hypothetical protein